MKMRTNKEKIICQKCKKEVDVDGNKIHDWVICPYCHWWNET